MKFFTYNESETSKHAFRLKITVKPSEVCSNVIRCRTKGTKVN